MHLHLKSVEGCGLIPSIGHSTSPGPGDQPVPLLSRCGQRRLGKVHHHIAGLVLNAVWRHTQATLESYQHTACINFVVVNELEFSLKLCVKSCVKQDTK